MVVDSALNLLLHWRSDEMCYQNHLPSPVDTHVLAELTFQDHKDAAQEKKQKKKRKAEEAAAQKPAGDDWNQGTHAWRPFDRERDLGHAPKPATPAEVSSARGSPHAQPFCCA